MNPFPNRPCRSAYLLFVASTACKTSTPKHLSPRRQDFLKLPCFLSKPSESALKRDHFGRLAEALYGPPDVKVLDVLACDVLEYLAAYHLIRALLRDPESHALGVVAFWSKKKQHVRQTLNLVIYPLSWFADSHSEKYCKLLSQNKPIREQDTETVPARSFNY